MQDNGLETLKTGGRETVIMMLSVLSSLSPWHLALSISSCTTCCLYINVLVALHFPCHLLPIISKYIFPCQLSSFFVCSLYFVCFAWPYLRDMEIMYFLPPFSRLDSSNFSCNSFLSPCKGEKETFAFLIFFRLEVLV